MSIIVFQHSPLGTPGRLGLTLRDHGFRMDIRRLDLPATRTTPHVPADFDNVDGVISLGGPQNVGDDLPWMKPEMEFLKEAHARRLPVIGICLGHQLLAHALGGSVGPMEKPEWGFPAVDQHPIANTDIILVGVPWSSRQFQAHGQEVKQLPAGATLLQSSHVCQVQAFRAGLRTYAFQYHFECDREMVRNFAESSVDELSGIGLSPADIKAQADEHYDRFAVIADRLCVNLATFLLGAGKKAVA
ncbi:MAG: type 1 glutamine amidotransferase [Phycisphaerales bacterium]